MAKVEGAWVPETPEEWQFIQRLNSLCGTAYEEGVEPEDITAGLAFMAASLGTKDPEDDESLPEVDTTEPEQEKRGDCPECGTLIDDVVLELGGRVNIVPCGCRVDPEEVPGWVPDRILDIDDD